MALDAFNLSGKVALITGGKRELVWEWQKGLLNLELTSAYGERILKKMKDLKRN